MSKPFGVKPKAYSFLRMSTDLQLKGDSRRRQLQASQAYAEAHDLDLANDAQLEDIGISAYKGANVKDGALGQFLAAVKGGHVEKGSYLIVESLDRLSREEILPAHTLFLSIVQSGINLVTLTDQRVYRAKTTGVVDMITSLVIMERAKASVSLAPSDLRDRGIARSLTYATKILGKKIDTGTTHWKDLLLMQELRNHLVHYGPDFADTRDHGDRFRKFANSNYVTLRPGICFTVSQIENLFDLYMTCVDDFCGSKGTEVVKLD